ncbi:MAG: O-antigen ligase family protein [Acidobacteria bacterium]|nr:O-antigen ligase family protein [Acidobacteriota bacterium]
MRECEAGTTWWRPEPNQAAALASVPGNRVAFGALVAFTGILLLTPQTFIPLLKVLRIALLAGGLAIAIHVVDATIRRKTVLTATPEVVTALTLLTWAVLTIPFSYWPGGSVALLTDQFIKAVVFFWLIATLVTTRERLRTFAWALVLCSIPLALTAIKHYMAGMYLTASHNAIQRIAGLSGLTGNPNDLALTLNLFIPVAGALLINSRSIGGRALASAALLLSIHAVSVTFSRAGFLTLCAIVVVSAIFFAKRRSLGPLVALLVLAFSVAPFLPDGYLDRVNTITDIEADPTGSAQGRWADFGLAARVAAQNPVIGVGLGQDILALDEARGWAGWRSVHNAYLQIAVDLGIPGLLMFLGLVIASFRSARRVELRSAREPAFRDLLILACGVQVALVAFVVGAFFHPIAYQFYFFCVAGLAVALKNACRTEIAAARC